MAFQLFWLALIFGALAAALAAPVLLWGWWGLPVTLALAALLVRVLRR